MCGLRRIPWISVGPVLMITEIHLSSSSNFISLRLLIHANAVPVGKPENQQASIQYQRSQEFFIIDEGGARRPHANRLGRATTYVAHGHHDLLPQKFSPGVSFKKPARLDVHRPSRNLDSFRQ